MSNSNTELMLAPKSIPEAMELATMMSKSELLPPHLRGKPADCFRIVAQAGRWGMDPFAVADKTSVISGKMMYEGQLTAAVVNSRGNLKSRLRYDFDGDSSKPATLVLTVSGTIQGEDEPRTINLTHGQAKSINRNGQIDKNPEQQMCYIGARIWARRHMPELILGVYTPDELEAEEAPARSSEPVNVTPQPVKTERPALPAKKKGVAAAVEVVQDSEPEPVKQEQPSSFIEPDSEPVAVVNGEDEADAFELTSDEPSVEPIRSLKAGEEATCSVTVNSVKAIKIGGKDAWKATLTGEYEGDVLSFLSDKFGLVESGGSLTMALKGVASSKDPSVIYTFAESVDSVIG